MCIYNFTKLHFLFLLCCKLNVLHTHQWYHTVKILHYNYKVHNENITKVTIKYYWEDAV